MPQLPSEKQWDASIVDKTLYNAFLIQRVSCHWSYDSPIDWQCAVICNLLQSHICCSLQFLRNCLDLYFAMTKYEHHQRLYQLSTTMTIVRFVSSTCQLLSLSASEANHGRIKHHKEPSRLGHRGGDVGTSWTSSAHVITVSLCHRVHTGVPSHLSKGFLSRAIRPAVSKLFQPLEDTNIV